MGILPLFICASVGGHLGCLHLLAMVSDAAKKWVSTILTPLLATRVLCAVSTFPAVAVRIRLAVPRLVTPSPSEGNSVPPATQP